MTLTKLMEMDYVTSRYEFKSVEVLVPTAEGEAFVTIGLVPDADASMFVASGKSESASLVNLAALVSEYRQSPDVEEHVCEYYSGLPKYQGVAEDELWKFADTITEKFRKGEVISEEMMCRICTEIENVRSKYSTSYTVVHVSENIQPMYKEFYDIKVFEPVSTDDSNWCAICDVDIPASEDFCEKCAQNMMK